MRRILSTLLAGAMVATTAAASFAPAQAMPQVPQAQAGSSVIQVERDAQWWLNQGGSGRNGGWDRGRRHGWNNGHGGWDNDGWRGDRRYYRRHRDRDWDDNDGAGLALGLFGFAAGAVVGSQLQGGQAYGGGYDAHDAACARRFRSYDPYSNTYLGYDGYRHYC